ncbi:SAM-dependent methyltransferase [Paenibacillus aurantius]|uniref:SAM-dependent methyltransferase n=1 Tax=Paenibacillus aurantius TaxID=2918900 RepID=A0AA96RER3_9BACL|nr:SAM-dependent methyltransferase [Paenibacillus aurantius]WNQ10468.1 SAM-dependent methyltransferase [Paenibacillus aurantius]
MEEIEVLVNRLIGEGQLLQAVLSGPRRKAPDQASKIKVKPVLLKGKLHYQFSSTVGQKELHDNLEPAPAALKLAELLREAFKQGLLQSAEADYQVLVNKKGKAALLRKPATRKPEEAGLSHNRRKNYLLEEGVPVPFLVELGVMTREGKVAAAKYDKFRQINRFLEMIDDVMPALADKEQIRIIDFGCGKSYLTFALYHYLVQLQGKKVTVTGLDLKEDVIRHCSALAARLEYSGLRFEMGDIADYSDAGRVDMVVTLHACDTATDAALEKAVRWEADVILSVPCCQHELFGQVKSETLAPMLTHGIIKERFSALATDSVRARLLELVGYRTQLLEFIDLEHTPKNLLIRAVKQSPPDKETLARLAAEYKTFRSFLAIDPYLERALADRLGDVLAGRQDQDADRP